MPFRTRKNPDELLKSILAQDAALKESMGKKETGKEAFGEKSSAESSSFEEFSAKNNDSGAFSESSDFGGKAEDNSVSGQPGGWLDKEDVDETIRETEVGEKVRQELLDRAVEPPSLMGSTLDEQAENAEKMLSAQEESLPLEAEDPLAERGEEDKTGALPSDKREEGLKNSEVKTGTGEEAESEVEKKEELISEETQAYQEAYSEEMNEDMPPSEPGKEEEGFHVQNQEPDNLNPEGDSFVEDIPVLSEDDLSSAPEKDGKGSIRLSGKKVGENAEMPSSLSLDEKKPDLKTGMEESEEDLSVPHLPPFLQDKSFGNDGGEEDTFVPSSRVVSSFEADEEDEAGRPALIDDRPAVRFELPKAIMYEKENTYAFSFGRGQEVFAEASERKTVRLDEAGQAHGYSLKEWNLVIIRLQLIPLLQYAGQMYDLPKDGVHGGLLIGPNEVIMPITNPSEIDVPNSFDFPLSKTKENHFLLGALGFQSSKDWGLALNTMKVINLDNKWGETLSFNGESGMLIGPENSVLYFFNLGQLVLPRNEQPEGEHFYPENMIISPVKDSAFYLDETQESQALEGTMERSVIVVQTDAKAYGWHVAFENGIDMNLLDVCEYQRRNHYLPDAAGMIYFGDKEFSFSKITQIQMYTKTRYAGYTG